MSRSRSPTNSPAATSGGGELVVVSTPIGNLGDVSPRALAALEGADIVCCEDTRHTGMMLKRLGIGTRRLLSLHGHNEAARIPFLVEELAAGHTVALVSDAGTPAISDPGERLVAAAAEAGLRVTAVPGPSAVLAALVVSGMGLGRWRFEGFLPRKGRERRARLADIASSPCPSVCYESPHRVAATLSDLAGECEPERRVAVCRELTKLHEEVRRSSLGEAAAHFEQATPKGEFVLVVDGAAPVATAGETTGGGELASAVEALVATGTSRRDAIRAVSEQHGLPRGIVYQAAIGASGTPGGRARAR
jgi:16S rRNA (cytidine1402-2'-O)-methyltransferase